ncbi:hypothetical protein [Paenibacillus planticolens]|uniref:GNAT family N-acetyltransferase n=1 Tax=Paenibacillus planticolens TaxID=2654976 RepID=A0ABX1ZLZ4_9BACL|nr:hypothetical protein [Paenibacillus planticolens]NOV01066.1 hypothetical protein [Paenibacillus planticolens]
MTAMSCKRCVTDDDFAQASLFFLANRRDMHPSYSTIDTITLLYRYMKQGRIIQALDRDERMIGVSAYYHGTPEHDFEDKHIALMDMAVLSRTHRGSRMFLKGLSFMVDEITAGEPDVQEIQLAALADNVYLCRLYAKFTDSSREFDSEMGKQVIFSVKINNLKAFLDKYKKV